MQLSITNPFSKPPVNPIQFGSLAGKQTPPEETSGAVASNPIKTMDPAKAEEQLRTYSAAASSYGMAQIAMQAGNNNSGGMIGTETTGTTG